MAKLFFRYGAMNSGKTTILLQTAYNYEERGMKVLIPLINTMVPILTKSSKSTAVFSYYLAKKTTNLKLCSIKISLAFKSPSSFKLI